VVSDREIPDREITGCVPPSGPLPPPHRERMGGEDEGESEEAAADRIQS